MTSKNDPSTSPAERVFASYSRLANSATQLNAVSDELGKSIATLDLALKKLNLGISSWTRISRYEDDKGEFWQEEIGYAKVGGKWGIALRTTHGHEAFPEDASSEQWLFNDAPRALRVEAIDNIPELLDKLIEAADKTAKKIRAKTAAAQDLAAAINQAARQK